jgi:DNA-binding NarL/FixJ family response regulator
VTRVPIDVCIISHSLEDQPTRGIEVVREMRALRPHIKCVILLDSSRPQDIVDCFRAGAKGIFCKNDRLESLGRCIRTVYEGQIWAKSADLDLALEALTTVPMVRATNQKGLDLLSARERQVIQYLAAGMTNNEIANALGLSHHTVKNYLFRIFDKLGVSNRTELLSLTLNSIPAPSDCACGEAEHFSCVLEAAESGMVSAQLRLAEQLTQVDGQPPDLVSAYMWYLIAEKNTCFTYEQIVEAKSSVSRTLSPRQRAEAEQRAEGLANGKKKLSASAGQHESGKPVAIAANS